MQLSIKTLFKKLRKIAQKYSLFLQFFVVWLNNFDITEIICSAKHLRALV